MLKKIMSFLAGKKAHHDKSFDEWLDKHNKEIENKIANLQADNREWEKMFGELMFYQNAGMNLEREGNLEAASEKYEKAIIFGRNNGRMKPSNYFYSYERLAIVYRKLKRYDDEVRIIEAALEENIAEADRNKFRTRLEKSMRLKEKA